MSASAPTMPATPSVPRTRFPEMLWVYLILLAVSDFRHWGVFVFAVAVVIAHGIWDYSRVWGPRSLGDAPPTIDAQSLFGWGSMALLGILVIQVAVFGLSWFIGQTLAAGSAGSLFVWFIPHAVFLVVLALVLTLGRWLAMNPTNHSGLLRFFTRALTMLLLIHLAGSGIFLHGLLTS